MRVRDTRFRLSCIPRWRNVVFEGTLEEPTRPRPDRSAITPGEIEGES